MKHKRLAAAVLAAAVDFCKVIYLNYILFF